MKSSDEIREIFLKYFEEKEHKRVKSSALVPKNDPTLLFTNAGMNQFKDVFLGRDRREYSRATSSQKCMRVSGKHNDLETVGRTPRHHTFFEMLGNFSFGDYFKTEAIEFAWELCTEIYGLDKDRLIITVFEEDDEAFGIWRDHVGVSEDRIYRCDEHENFWSMGDTGPCGPCSELHYDMGDLVGDTTSPFGADCDRFMEIWNLVFMQFNRDSSGKMTPLPSPSIDTGMGLERIACVLQGVGSNYETDLFTPIIAEAGRLTGVPYGTSPDSDTSLRILADHCRATMFLIDDGIVPGNEGRGYVLRKILRRAIRHGRMLGKEEPFIYTLTALVAELMHHAYPELDKSREYAAKVVKHEEEKFSATLSTGLGRLEDVFERLAGEGQKTVPGEDLFRLYDTYGFPFDLATEIAGERGFQVDISGFNQELEQQRQRARASWKGGEAHVQAIHQKLAARTFKTTFTGYDEITEVEAKVLALVAGDEEVTTLSEGDEGEVILDRTPFYSEAGGQVADQGSIEGQNLQAEVLDVQTPVGGVRLHKIRVLHGEISVGDSVSCSVDRQRRLQTVNNHTATHLLQAALRNVLGEHVKQAGSLVAPERLRFDFTHYKGLSSWELHDIEEKVNLKIRENIKVQTSVQDLDEAIEAGATALFGEKYDQKVRVVSVPGYSKELCGGTHVDRTGDIALFKILSESSISAGVRRVEAITGEAAVDRFLQDEALLGDLSHQLNTRRDNLSAAVVKLVGELKEASKEVDRLRLQLAQQESSSAGSEAREIGGIKVVAQKVSNVDRNALRQLADQICNKLQSGVVVLGTSSDGKVSLVVMVSDDLKGRVPANRLIQPIARLVGGGGGGKPDLAEAGGKNPDALDEAIQQTYSIVEEQLGA
ncbi:MAG: alanine--tRNA ligase [Acidobacteriota bacterium]|nr:MAG: alanine--tRNA ligase [Acidobacteriota bacterium]